MKKKHQQSLEKQAEKPFLRDIKGMLTRDEQKKIVGGYWLCSGWMDPCPQCQYAGQFVNFFCA